MSISSVAQNVDVDLSKFSYLVIGFYDIKAENGLQTFKTTQGTCFFIRNNSKLFLVSAKHTLTAWDPEVSQKRTSFPDKLNLRIFDTAGNAIHHSLDMKKANESISGGYTYDDPDIYMVEFPDDPKYVINSVEGFIDSSITIKQGDNIMLYGYPVDYAFFGKAQLDALQTKKPTLVTAAPLSSDSPYRNDMLKRLETLNYAIQRTDTINRAGCSGAPVFVLQGDGWKFGGIFINSSLEVPVSLVLKPEFVFAKLDDNP